MITNSAEAEQKELFGKEEIEIGSAEFEETAKAHDKSMCRLKPIDRRQMLLRAVEVERLIPEDHEARAIWEFVGRLDLSEYYKWIESVEGSAGRPAYDPQLLISVWIYSYSKGISSAREICRLCEYHPAYQWLTAMDSINYHTLSDFRANNLTALDKLFTETLGLLSAEGLITLERVMHDGTKVLAHASGKTYRREKKIREHLKLAEEQVKFLNEASDEEMSLRTRKARERALREKKEKLELALKELEKIRAVKKGKEEKENARVSETDPEARIMKQGNGGFASSYNVQISTDSKEKIIVGVHMSQSSSDYEELKSSEEEIERRMGRKPEQMVVDGGFISRENILYMNKEEIDLIGPVKDITAVSEVQQKIKGTGKEFGLDAFHYNAVENNYTCPAGKRMSSDGKQQKIGATRYSYRAKKSDCQTCEFKLKCCPGTTGGRSVMRGEEDACVTVFKEKMKTDEAKSIYKQRSETAEFPNAWIKDKLGLRRFRLRGTSKAGLETLWASLTYDIQQWIRLIWRPELALRTA